MSFQECGCAQQRALGPVIGVSNRRLACWGPGFFFISESQIVRTACRNSESETHVPVESWALGPDKLSWHPCPTITSGMFLNVPVPQFPYL